MNLDKKTVIVTGAGSGIGRALAIAFAGSGANVVCCGRRKERLGETVALVEECGANGLAAATDITDSIQVDALVKATLNRFGAIHVLFNNAGRFNSLAGVHELAIDDWWQDVTVNLYGSMLVIRHVLPVMMDQDEGIIISMDGGRPVGGSGYACGKAGLMQLSKILSQELEMQNSSVIAMCAGPGLVRTEMTELQVESEAGQKWIPSTKELFDNGGTRAAEDIADVTIKIVEAATSAFNGKSFGPDSTPEDLK